jgi:WD40 repeat protein
VAPAGGELPPPNDGPRLLISQGASIEVRDQATLERWHVLHPPVKAQRVTAVVTYEGPLGLYIASLQHDGALTIWDANSYDQIAAQPPQTYMESKAAALSAYWDLTATAPRLVSRHDDALRVWDGATGELLLVLGGGGGPTMVASEVYVTPTGAARVAAIAERPCGLWLWCPSTGALLASGGAEAAEDPSPPKGGIVKPPLPRLASLPVSGEGRSLVARGGNKGRLRVYDGESGELLRAWHDPRGSDVIGVTLSGGHPDGDWVVVGNYDRSITVWTLSGAGGAPVERVRMGGAEEEATAQLLLVLECESGWHLLGGVAGYSAILWNLETGGERRVVGPYVSAALVYEGPDRHLCAALAGWSPMLRLYDLGEQAAVDLGGVVRSAAKRG